MAHSIGTLVGFVELDYSPMEKSLALVESKLGGASKVWARVLGDAGKRAGAAAGDGLSNAAAPGLDAATDKFTDAGDDAAEGFGGSFKGKLPTLVKGGALAAAGAFSVSLASAISAEPANDKLVAQLGLTGKESKRVGKVAGSLFANAYGDSLSDVNDAVAAVYKNIDGMSSASSKDLSKVTASVLDVSNAFDQDLAMTTAAVGTMMRTGMAKDATEALDIITKGLQGPANKADDLLETFNEYSVQFQKLGLDGKDALGLLQQGLRGGARDADVVADALKEFSIRTQEALEQTDSNGNRFLTGLGAAFQNTLPSVQKLTDGLYAGKVSGEEYEETMMDAIYGAQDKLAKGGKAARGVLDSMLEGLGNIKDPAFKTKMAVALFGTQAEDLGASLYSLDLDTAANGIGKIGGAAEKMGKTLNDNASANIETFKRRAQQAFVNTLGGRVLPIVTQLTSSLTVGLSPALSAVVGFLSKHTTTAKVLVGVLTGLVAVTAAHEAITSVSAAGGMAKWLAMTKPITMATKVWTAVNWALNSSILANPIGLIVLALAAVAIGLVVAYRKSETFRDIVNGAFGAVKDVIGGVADFFTEKIPDAMDWVVEKGKKWGPYLLAAVLPIVGVPLLIAQHWDTIKAKTSELIDGTVDWFTALPGRIGGGLASLGSTVVGLFRDAMNAGKDKAVSIGGSILDWYLGMPGRIGGKLGGIVGTVRDLFRDAMQAGKDKVTGLGADIHQWIAGIPDKLASLGARFGTAGRGLLQDFIDGMKNAAGIISGIAGNIWDTVRGLLNGAIDKVNAALEFTIDLPLGKSVGINPANIPHLRTGGRVGANDPQMAWIGDANEPESVLRDSQLRALLREAVASARPQEPAGPHGPLINTVVQAPGESTDALAERLWFLTNTRG